MRVSEEKLSNRKKQRKNRKYRNLHERKKI